MWQKVKKSVKLQWEKITSRQVWIFTFILIAIWILSMPLCVISRKFYVLEIGIGCMVIAMVICILVESKEMKEKEEAERKKKEVEKNKQREEIENIFGGRKKIEVRLNFKTLNPYHTEKCYKDLGNLIFLHILVFIHEAEVYKCYAEWCEEAILTLYIHTDKGNKEYPEFPKECFLKYFEPIED